MHGKLFGMDETALSAAYFRYLATFKIVVIVFNVVPWIALQIVT